MSGNSTEYILGESSMSKIDRTSPLIMSSFAFFLSSIYLIIAGNTIASPDHINTLLIDFGEIELGNCLSSVSSNANKMTGFFG